MSLSVVHYDSPVLRQTGARIKVFDAAVAELAREMITTMHEARGIGLAAQQIGRALQLCVLDLRETDLNFDWQLDGTHPPPELFMPMAMANPVITVQPGADDYVLEEGCLSFPDIRGDVVRPGAISVKFKDEHGVPHTLVCDGLLSRCIQHEADHLNGVLFIDRMAKRVRQPLEPAIQQLARQTRAERSP